MLEILNLSASYGKLKVLHGVDLAVGVGQMVGLFGHNGAGKSALLKSIFGLLPVTDGSVTFAGVDTTRARPFEKSALGIRFVPQEGNVFPSLSVEDNLRLGALKLPGGSPSLAVRFGEIYDTFPILRERRLAAAQVLSGGERQMLAISIALMTAPKLLLLDEPSVGLAPIAVRQLFEMIGQIHERLGTAVLLVEQNLTEALHMVKQVYVLEEGRVVYRGPSREKDQIVRHLWRLASDGQAGGQ
jgi:branched-chain amino acid transport system ATP-binding protein